MTPTNRDDDKTFGTSSQRQHKKATSDQYPGEILALPRRVPRTRQNYTLARRRGVCRVCYPKLGDPHEALTATGLVAVSRGTRGVFNRKRQETNVARGAECDKARARGCDSNVIQRSAKVSDVRRRRQASTELPARQGCNSANRMPATLAVSNLVAPATQVDSACCYAKAPVGRRPCSFL